VTLVDISQDVLDKSAGRIGESIKRVAKKECKDDQVLLFSICFLDQMFLNCLPRDCPQMTSQPEGVGFVTTVEATLMTLTE